MQANKHKTKLCSMCGKAESSNWAEHWKRWHDINDQSLRIPLGAEEQPEKPWCSNWKQVTTDGVTPIDIISKYQRFMKHAPKSSKSMASKNVRQQSARDLEENKDRFAEFAVPPQTRKNVPLIIDTTKKNFTTQQNNDEDMGFYDSDLDGEIAHQQVKGFVEGTFAAYNNVSAQFPSITTSNKKTSVGQTSSTTALEDQKKALQKTQQWKAARDVIQQQLFQQLPHIDFEFALSFFIQAAESQEKIQHIDFVPAFAAVIEATNLNKIPKFILELYQQFFSQYQVQESHTTDDLHQLYKLAQLIKANIEWLKETEEPQIIIIENEGQYHERFLQWIEVVRLFMEFRNLYSWDYIHLMKTQLDSCAKYRMPNLRTFLTVLSHSKVTFNSSRLSALLEKFLEVKGGNLQQIQETAGRILNEFSFDMSVLLSYVEVGLKGSLEVLLQQLREGKEPMTVEQLLHFNNLAQKENQLKHEALLLEQKKVAEEEETKRFAAEQELQKQKELEEEKQRAEEEKHLQQQQFTTSLRSSFDFFAAQNQFAEEVFSQVLSFVDDLQRVAATIKKELRPEQLVTLGLLLLSQKHTTLIQLATGAGKSLMLGILAQYLNQTTGKKVIVVVPTSFLHAYQQHNYCPNASKIPEDMADSAIMQVFYSDFGRFLAPEFAVPDNTILLVDEFHELFFDQQVTLVNGKVVSVIFKLLSAAQVIGVSATYRGDKGIKAITSLLQNSIFIKPPQQLQEKELRLEVLGRVHQQEIISKAIALAQEKAKIMPVIIFCNDTTLFQQHLQEAIVFSSNEVGELNAALRFLRTSSNAIVLTTSTDSKGVDFVFAVPQAFVIHATLPKSLVQLKQDSGRGVRGNDMPIVGALFTEKMYFSLEDVRLGLAHAEQFDRLYPADYLQSLHHLKDLKPPTTEPQLKALAEAVAALNNGQSFSVICGLLSQSTAFKKALPKNDFKAPVPMLSKRLAPEKSALQREQKLMDSFFQKKQQEKRKEQEKEEEKQEQKKDEEMKEEEEDDEVSSFADAGAQLKPDILQQHNQHQVELMIASAGKNKVPSSNSSAILFGSSTNKREKKAADKAAEKEEEWEKKSKVSDESGISRSTNGRFAAKYRVGDKAADGSIIKDVREDEWELVERDKKGNSYYKCLKCSRAVRVLKGDRRKHACRSQ